MKSFCLFREGAQDGDQWRLRVKGKLAKTVVTYKIKHLQKCFSVLFCMCPPLKCFANTLQMLWYFVLHVTTVYLQAVCV